MSERLFNSNRVKASAAAVVATLALSACAGETKQDSWVFSVDCGEGSLDIEKIENKSFEEKITIECGNEGEVYAPESVELLSGTGVTIDDDVSVSEELLTVSYDYIDGGMSPANPKIESVEIKDASAEVVMDEVRITGVVVG